LRRHGCCKRQIKSNGNWLAAADRLQRLLREAGHEVVGPVARLGDALQLARHENLDGVLLDINLAGVNSYAVA